MRASALKNGLDPDNTLPEDILLLQADDKGNLKVQLELAEAENNIKYDLKLESLRNAT